jgi:hypothetical protein
VLHRGSPLYGVLCIYNPDQFKFIARTEPINVWLIEVGISAVAAVGSLKLIEWLEDRKR